MTKQSLIADAGAKAFWSAAERARAAAGGIKRQDRPREDPYASEDYSLFSSLVEALMTAPLPRPEQMRLLFELYREAPAFTLIDHLFVHHWRDLDPDARAAFWTEVQSVLAGTNDRLAAPVEYALWCDFFEDPDTVHDAWSVLSGPGLPPRVLERILVMSGPVPYPLKRPVYERLLGDERWHVFIFRSLLHSAHDVYGSIDIADARRVYGKLRLSPQTDFKDALEAKLRGGDT